MIESGAFDGPLFSKRNGTFGAQHSVRGVSGARRRTDGPSDSGRRRLLMAMGAVTLTALVGAGYAITQEGDSVENPYDGWENLQGQYLPKDKMLGIAADLEKDITFPGFHEVGELIRDAQVEPGRLKEYFPNHDGFPVSVFFDNNLINSASALARLTVEFGSKIPFPVSIKNRNTHEVTNGTFVKHQDARFTVAVDGSSYAAPEAAKRLLLVKEFSHFLYFRDHARQIAGEFLKNYELLGEKPEDFEWLLYANAQEFFVAKREGALRVPSFGDLFDHAAVDLDGAAYFHTIPAFGKMRSRGLFTRENLKMLESGNIVFEKALAVGILRNVAGEYKWIDGIGPFSPKWTSIMRPVSTSIGKYSHIFTA